MFLCASQKCYTIFYKIENNCLSLTSYMIVSLARSTHKFIHHGFYTILKQFYIYAMSGLVYST